MVQGVWLLLQLATDLAVVHMMLVLQVCRMQELQNYGSFYPDFKGRSGSQAMYDKVRVPASSPCEGDMSAVRVKPQWRSRMLEMPGMQRKTLGNKWSHPKREAWP
jgi:hypothetical protein